MNTTLLLMMALPIVMGGIFYYFNKNVLPWWSVLASMIPGMLVVGAAFGLSHGSATGDIEIISGKIVSKDRIQKTYEEAYDCNPHQVQSGKDANGRPTYTTKYDTCYRTHWTVEWVANSTVGEFQIEKFDKTSKSVWNSPDPVRYTNTVIGEPAAKQHRYTNYIQAVPNSLFAKVDGTVKNKFKGYLPNYPDQVYDLYKINRLVTQGVTVQDAKAWNDDLSNMLRELGPAKQVNAIVVLTNIIDPSYADALKDHWDGANKNDVVLVISTEDGKNINAAHVISWTKNELFKIELKDRIEDIQVLDRVQIMQTLDSQIKKNFDRRKMKEFEYLDTEIDPPNWVIILTAVILVLGYLGAGFYIRSQGVRIRRF